MMASMPRGALWIAGGFAVLAAALVPVVNARLELRRADAQPSAERPPITVRTVVARAAASTPGPALIATGTLEADRQARLSFPVAGVVDRVAADAGDRVPANAVLARLDSVPFEALLDQARARLRYLDTRLERVRELYATEGASKEQLDGVTAEHRAAAADVRLAEWNLSRATLRAPFAGRVLARWVEVGQVVGPEAPAYELLAVDSLKVTVGVAARDLGSVAPGDPVQVTLTDRPELTSEGRVDHFPVAGDPRSGTVPVVVKLAARDERFLPGLAVACTFGAADAGSGGAAEVRIPLTALRVSPEGSLVLRVESAIARAVVVRTGEVRGDEIVVLAGLAAGDVLVDEPPDRLKDGDRVEIAGAGANAP